MLGAGDGSGSTEELDVGHRQYIVIGTWHFTCRSRASGVTCRAMKSIERRDFLKTAAALPFLSPLRSFAQAVVAPGRPAFVAAGADATGAGHQGPRANTHLDFKVLTK